MLQSEEVETVAGTVVRVQHLPPQNLEGRPVLGVADQLHQEEIVTRFDDGHPPALAEINTQSIEVGRAVIEVMVRVAQEGEIVLAVRKEWVVQLGVYDDDVRVAAGLDSLAQSPQDIAVHVHRVDAPLRSDDIRELEGEVALPRDDVCDMVAGPEDERFDDAIGTLQAGARKQVQVVELGQPRTSWSPEDAWSGKLVTL